MRTVLVTGCAGFIGSHITEACLARGDRVVGVDTLNDNYSVGQKLDNLRILQQSDRFEFVHADVADVCRDLLDGIEVVFHQAGQPGVRESWRQSFVLYLSRNVATTQYLLEAAATARTPRFVFASSSSIYGNAPIYPVNETELPRPLSPYGVTKLAAEQLCSVYAANFGLSVVSLRYFTVYGPRQRPDMAIHRLIESALRDVSFGVFGDGSQVRDFTFVSDVVRANLAAADADVRAGLVVNIAGGTHCSLSELIATVGAISGADVMVKHGDEVRGDVWRTGGSIELAQRELGWAPVVSLTDGVAEQVRWHQTREPRV